MQGDDDRRNLSARHGRLRTHAALRRLARQRARGGAVRHQLRGRRREQHPAWRRGLGSLPVRNRRRSALAGHAAHEHGVDLRIRLARRLLAAAPHVHRTLRARHRLCGRDRHGAQPRSGRRHERGGVGNRHPRPEMDRLSRYAARGRGAPHRRGGAHSHRSGRIAAARLLSGALVAQHRPARHGGRRLPLLRRRLRRRPPLLARRAARAAADHALHARLQRHALRDAAGLQLGRPVLRLSQGFVRHALRRRRRRAENAVDRAALPARRPSGEGGVAGPIRRLRPRPRSRLDADPTRHRASLDPQARAERRLEAVAPDPHPVRRALRRRLRAFALDRGGSLRRGPDGRSGHGRRAGEGDGGRGGERDRTTRSGR